jgi:hypothetical protein
MRTWVRCPPGTRQYSPLRNVRTVPGALRATYTTETGGELPGGGEANLRQRRLESRLRTEELHRNSPIRLHGQSIKLRGNITCTQEQVHSRGLVTAQDKVAGA